MMDLKPGLLFALLAVTVLLPAFEPGAAHEGHEARPHEPGSGVWISEVVTDPQSDRTGEGGVTTIDEYVSLYNAGPDGIDLEGWVLTMNDTTPEDNTLSGIVAPGATRTIHNPAGQMNNDVDLILTDAHGAVQDRLRLGQGSIPDGNAGDVFDEAVHLIGPWAAARAPASNGTGLAAFWVEWVARATTTPDEPFQPAWAMTGEVRLDVRLHPAPDVTLENVTVTVDGAPHDATPSGGGVWRTDAFTIPGSSDVDIVVSADAEPVDSYPGRDPLVLRLDATPPLIADEEIVANGTRHVRWLPLPTDAESGITTWNVTATNATDEWRLDGCAPHDDPAATCRLPADNVTIRISAENGAGGTTQRTLTIRNDTTPPGAPEDDWFETGPPPTWSWTPFAEPLKRLDVDIADDVTGVWIRGTESLDPGATTFVDDSWVAGDPRAYRLVARDRADHVTTTEWVALPPESVPVQWTFEGSPGDLAEGLVRDGNAAIELTFDRALAEAPSLVIDVQTPRPARVVTSGQLGPGGAAAHYVVEVPESFPSSGRGTWAIEGGAGSDGAPMDAAEVVVTWDNEAPRLDAVGASDSWIRAVRHVITLHAVDALDPDAEVDLDRTGKGILVRKAGHGRQVTFTKEGEYEVTGAVRDANGNAQAFIMQAALDGTPPRVVLDAALPTTWSDQEPIKIRMSDEVSGLNRSSVQAWVRADDAAVQARVVDWDDDVVRLVPDAGALAGPLDVHVAVADVAGNLAEGTVAREAVPLRSREAGDDPVVVGNASGGAAPQPAGPGWLVPGVPSSAPGSGQAGGAAGDGASAAGARAETDGDGRGADRGLNTPDGMWDWVVLGVVGAGGSVGLSTVVRRNRGRATGRRSSSPTPDGTRTPPRSSCPVPTAPGPIRTDTR